MGFSDSDEATDIDTFENSTRVEFKLSSNTDSNTHEDVVKPCDIFTENGIEQKNMFTISNRAQVTPLEKTNDSFQRSPYKKGRTGLKLKRNDKLFNFLNDVYTTNKLETSACESYKIK